MMDFPEYRHCTLCPRQCGVDRTSGRRGFCGEGASLHLADVEAHFGEEPPLVGTQGSGTVFLTGCSCGCFFCQNYQLSTEHLGEFWEVKPLAERLLALAERGVRNINLVTPDHFWPHLKAVLQEVRNAGCDLPVIWNSGGYSARQTLQDALENGVEIFLPDFKYATAELARECMGREDYPQVALEGLELLVDRVGFLRPFDSTGEMAANRGVLVRHLVLPGETANSLAVLELLARRFGPMLPLSVMRQFRPMPQCQERGRFTRMVTDQEYQEVMEQVRRLGFQRVFFQPESGDANFVPDFRQKEAPFRGNALARLSRQKPEQ